MKQKGNLMSSSKGSKYERELVYQLQDLGLVAERQPLSGSIYWRWPHDIKISDEFFIEAKFRKNASGYKNLINLYDAGHRTIASIESGFHYKLMMVDEFRDEILDRMANDRLVDISEDAYVVKALTIVDSWFGGEVHYVACRVPTKPGKSKGPWLLIRRYKVDD